MMSMAMVLATRRRERSLIMPIAYSMAGVACPHMMYLRGARGTARFRALRQPRSYVWYTALCQPCSCVQYTALCQLCSCGISNFGRRLAAQGALRAPVEAGRAGGCEGGPQAGRGARVQRPRGGLGTARERPREPAQPRRRLPLPPWCCRALAARRRRAALPHPPFPLSSPAAARRPLLPPCVSALPGLARSQQRALTAGWSWAGPRR